MTRLFKENTKSRDTFKWDSALYFKDVGSSSTCLIIYRLSLWAVWYWKCCSNSVLIKLEWCQDLRDQKYFSTHPNYHIHSDQYTWSNTHFIPSDLKYIQIFILKSWKLFYFIILWGYCHFIDWAPTRRTGKPIFNSRFSVKKSIASIYPLSWIFEIRIDIWMISIW